jgi:hypothetical protein
MTPLAYRIVKDMTLPVKRRTFQDRGGLLPQFREEFHCFEVTQIYDAAGAILDQMLVAAFPSVEWSFLPAARTWIEFDDKNGERIGFMLVRQGGGQEWATVYCAARTGPNFLGGRIGVMALSNSLAKTGPLTWNTIEHAIFRETLNYRLQNTDGSHVEPYEVPAMLWRLYAFLLLINTPKVIGRKVHDPHRGLAREVLARRKILGIFPLQAWTEILLSTETVIVDGDSERIGTTGTKALHWTRAHKRRIHGIWTLIADYWAGDGSLGIKRSRYVVVPPERERAPCQ